MSRSKLWVFITVIMLLSGYLYARGGWDDPPGGWDLIYDANIGECALPYVSGATTPNVLDGSWHGGEDTYFSDGSPPGDYVPDDPAGNAPGGAAILELIPRSRPSPLLPRNRGFRRFRKGG